MTSTLNKLFKKLTTPLILVILLKSFHLMAQPGGGMDGGGGRSVVCRDNKGQIKKAELFDFYEGKIQYNINPVISPDQFETQVETMIQRMGQGRGTEFIETLRRYAQFVIASKQVLPDGTGLLPVEDSKHVIMPPKDCQYEQLANFTNQNQVLINGEIWNVLDNTNKAGLVVHEAIYKVFRDYGATDSTRARKAVAITFSGVASYPPVFDGFPEKPLRCHTLPNNDGSPFPGTSFYVYNTADGELHFQFDYIDGQLMLSNTNIGIDKIPKEKLLDENGIPLTTYWIPLESFYDKGTVVAISFQPKDFNKEHRKIMRIGIRNMPTPPTQEFMCGQSDDKSP